MDLSEGSVAMLAMLAVSGAGVDFGLPASAERSLVRATPPKVIDTRLRALNRLQGVSDASAGCNFYDTRSLGLYPPRRVDCSQRTRCHLPAPAAWCRLLVHQYQAWPSVRIRHAARAKPVTQGRIKVL